VSALPAYLEPDCDCLLIEEHLDRCRGRVAPQLPEPAPRPNATLGELRAPARETPRRRMNGQVAA
jgi:hypothetical protein